MVIIFLNLKIKFNERNFRVLGFVPVIQKRSGVK